MWPRRVRTLGYPVSRRTCSSWGFEGTLALARHTGGYHAEWLTAAGFGCVLHAPASVVDGPRDGGALLGV